MLFEIAVLLTLIVVNGLFAGAEIATVTLRQTQIDRMRSEGRRAAEAIATLRAVPERFLATVQVGITVVGAAAAAYGGDTFSDRIAPLLVPLLGESADAIALILVVAVISFLSLVLGELVPKSLALRSAESYALLVARPLVLLAQLARPLIWVLTKSSNLILRFFGDSTSFSEARVSADELKAMLVEAGAAGSLHPRVGEIAARAVELGDLTAYDIMVPRNRIRAVERTISVEAFRDFVRTAAHSRIPVFEGGLDHIVGYVTVRDVYANLSDDKSLSDIVREIPFVPETARATEILGTLQTLGAELAIVVDEHGSTAGMLTREDVSEELLGTARLVDRGARVEGVTAGPDGSYILEGGTQIRELNRECGLNLPEDDEFTTIAGLLIHLTNRIPARGERCELPDGRVLEVLDASARTVRSVRLHTAGHVRPERADP